MTCLPFDLDTPRPEIRSGEYLIVDSFAGGGGASTAIEMALGRSPDIAVNHDETALRMHAANHPETLHLTENVWQVDLADYAKGRKIGLLWASPDCRHFSKARGGAPTSKSVRGLAWSIAKFVKQLGDLKPRMIMMENVEEFRTWEDFSDWKAAMRKFGYRIEMRELRACDYGAPTIRKRLFIIMRSDGEAIVWPEPTHGAPDNEAVIAGNLKPWRTASEIIDWSIPCPSIFDTSEQIKEKFGLRAIRPLADNTMKRVAHGVWKYVLNAQKPFLVNLTYGARLEGVDEPIKTVTAANRGEKAVVVPIISAAQHGGSVRGADQPHHTIAASRKDQNQLIVPTLATMGFGEREGQEPRVPGIHVPLRTITAGGNKAAIVSAFLAQHNKGVVGRKADAPYPTITTRGTQTQLVSAHIQHMKGSQRNDAPLESPLNTICAGGTHAALVSAFMIKYYGAGVGQFMTEPLHTVTTKERFGLVTVTINGQTYAIVDIGMRMLTPRELFNAQGFPENYIIDRGADGKPITKTDQIHKCGNSVSPYPARALVRANCSFLIKHKIAA